MSKIINELATIEVSDEAMKELDLGEIYHSFVESYRKLDDLKKFRTEYEKKNWLMRWWYNDKLREAHLDSAQVQAEFSKAIGQLMTISIMQSKWLAEQQTQLNEQQGKLKSQADGIEEHAGELQRQHQVLAEQSRNLEKLVHEYFELKGLTEDGARRLIEIANEIKSVKEGMAQEFSVRVREVKAQCNQIHMQMNALRTEISEEIRLHSEKTHACIAALRDEARDELASVEAGLRKEYQVAQQEMEGRIVAQAVLQRESVERQNAKNAELLMALDVLSEKIQKNTLITNEIQNELVSCARRQDEYKVAQVRFEKETSSRLNRLMLMIALVSGVMVIMLVCVAYILR